MTFPEFFRAAWGKEPFPWQTRLADLALSGKWPGSIGLPTAAGKTAVIDIAVYALAMDAPTAARRIFFVVDRRIIVDEAAERAEELARKLEAAAPNSDLGVIAGLLRKIGDGADSPALAVSALRGGLARTDFWKNSPRQPLVICSTVDQVGSSLLFRGYGASEYARPLRAALVSHDSLIIVDEAHTSQPFTQTLERLCRYRKLAAIRVDSPFSVVEMSATPRYGDVFREQDDDRAHPVLHDRWGASKKAQLIVAEKAAKGEAELEEADFDHAAMAGALAREARRIRSEQGAVIVGVIANRVRTARLAFELLDTPDEGTAILLVGRARPWDRDDIWKQWRDFIGLDGTRRQERPVFVVATQCIEVGANIDFDALVSEIASIDALEQRFGRLNRAGRPHTSHAAIVALKEQTGSKYSDPIYGKALSATWTWLRSHLTREGHSVLQPAEGKKKPKTKKIREEFVEMGVLPLRMALEGTEDRQSLVCPRVSAPVLLPAHMDLLCQTSPEPALTPEPAVFLHGPQSGPEDILVVWRQDLPSDIKKWVNAVSVCPPGAAEAVSLPPWEVRKWFRGKAAADIADIEGGPAGAGDRREWSGARRFLCWRGTENSVVLDSAEALRPGMTLVVPSEYGGCDRWGWNPESTDPVRDVGDAVKWSMGKPLLRLNADLAKTWNYGDLASVLRKCETDKEARSLLSGWGGADEESWLYRNVHDLASSRVKLLDDSDSELEDWVAIAARGKVSRDSVEASLDKHLAGCGRWALHFADQLPETLQATVVRAAELHDLGKADPRFQAWLRGGNAVKPGELIAKSKSSPLNAAGMENARVRAGYPKGGRHELMSVAMLSEFKAGDGVDKELLLHLIGSHHGRCRPFAPIVEDDKPVAVAYQDWVATSDHRLERLGSGVSERFWKLTRRYGWYGLAWLESLVRLSDYRQSAEEQRNETAKSGAANA